MGTLKPKKLKLITFTLRGSFFTFLAILAYCAAIAMTKKTWAYEAAQPKS